MPNAELAMSARIARKSTRVNGGYRFIETSKRLLRRTSARSSERAPGGSRSSISDSSLNSERRRREVTNVDDEQITFVLDGREGSLTRSVAETVSVLADPSPPPRIALPEQLVLGKERYGR